MVEKRVELFFVVLVFLMLNFVSGVSFSSEQKVYSFGEFDSEDKPFVLNLNNFSGFQIQKIEDSITMLKKRNLIKDYSYGEGLFFINFNKEAKIDKIVLDNKGLTLIEKSEGYIIEFEEPPVLVKKGQLEQEIKSLGIEKDETREVFRIFSLNKEISSKEKELDLFNEESYKKQLEKNHKEIKKEISSIKKQGDLSDAYFFGFFIGLLRKIGLTGFAVSEQISPVIEQNYFYVFNGISVKNISGEEAMQIKKIPGVKEVRQNQKVYVNLMDSVPLIQERILAGQLDEDGNDCLSSEKECLTGKGVKIAIIDTGVDYTHSDLGGCFGAGCKVIGGYDFINNDNDPMDDHGHGTHVAATAAGNGELKGVAPDAKILGYKVLDADGSGSWEGVIAGIEQAVIDDSDILSLSLGSGGNPDDPVSTAVDNAVLAGKVVVVAAGNSGPWEHSIGSPGTARKAITIGATTKENEIADFSSRGPVIWPGGYLIKPDIVAPGVDICAARWEGTSYGSLCLNEDGKHMSISGTSMATPHVSGAIALLKQKHPDWTPDEIKNLIKISADDLGYNLNTQGAGLINIPKALITPIIVEGDLFFENTLENFYEREIVIKNLKEEVLEINLIVGGAENDMGEKVFVLTSNETSFSIEPFSSKAILFSLNLSEINDDGNFIGRAVFEISNKNFSVPYQFGIYSTLNLEFPGHFPNYVIFDDSLERGYSAFQGWDFFGNKISYLIRSGNYTVFAVNDFVIPGNPEKDEYIIGKRVEVPFKDKANLSFSLSDGRLFVFEGKSKDRKDLRLYEWEKGLGVYRGNADSCKKYHYTDEETCVNNSEKWNCYFSGGQCYDKKFSSTWSQSGFKTDIGDRKIYLSNNPSKEFGVDVDILIKYWGAP